MSYVSNNNVKIHYEVEGKGQALVLQHGLYGSVEDWYEYGYVDAMKDHCRLVMIDARGHGRSEKPHDPALYAHYTRALDVIKVLDELGIAKCHYLGFSMGGWQSYGMMKWFPERFASYIIFAAHPYENDMSAMREGIRTMDTWVPAEVASAATRARYLANDREALLAAVAEKRDDRTDVLRQVTAPCLMIVGDRDGNYEKMKASARLSEKIEFVAVPGFGHADLFYRSEMVLPHVKRFYKIHNWAYLLDK